MTEDEFFAQLGMLQTQGWHAFADSEGAIRLRGDGEVVFDPITAVCRHVRKTTHRLRNVELAAAEICLEPQLARRICAASNGYPSASPVRTRLESALRLQLVGDPVT